MIKALAGGGGRGMRPVLSLDQLEDAYERCQSEAARRGDGVEDFEIGPQRGLGRGRALCRSELPRRRHLVPARSGERTGFLTDGPRKCVRRTTPPRTVPGARRWLGGAIPAPRDGVDQTSRGASARRTRRGR